MSQPTTKDQKPKTKALARRQSGLRPSSLVFSLPVLFLVITLLYPLGTILAYAFAEGARGLREALSASYTWRVLGFSIGQAALSTALTLALGMPGAYVFARYRFPGKRLLQAIAAVPFVMPTIVVAVAIGALLGPRGLLNSWLRAWLDLDQPPIRLQNGLGLVLLAHIFYNYTVVLRLVGGIWSQLDPQLEQAAAVLGASRWRTFRQITLPLLAPAIGAAAMLIFTFTFSSFGVIIILGGPRMATLEVEIYRQVAQLLRLDLAAALALIQLTCTLALSLLYARLSSRQTAPLRLQPRTVTARPPRSLAARVLVITNSLLIVLLLGAPLIALALRSLLAEDGGLSLAAYAALGENRTGSAFFVPPSVAIANSLRIAATTTVIAMAVGVPGAYLLAKRGMENEELRIKKPATHAGHGFQFSILNSQLLEALFMLPLGTSATTLGLGVLIALSVPTLAALRTSPWLVPVLHSLVALPFVVRALLPVLRARSPQLAEAAASLGAGPLRRWLRIELPLIAPALATGAIFAFTVSLGEFGATLLLARPSAPTLPVLIFRFLSQPGAINYAQALALSTLLMLLTAASFLIIERIRPPGGRF